MKPYNTSSYPVFEADQVLSQKDLNMAVSHLEEQDRITRKNLIGIGINCGLEISFPTSNQLKISCGSAVTSLGFQINFEENLFTHYKKGTLSDQFLYPKYTAEPYLDNFFKFSKKYGALKNFYELIPNGASDAEKIPIPNSFFDDKVIVLILELTLVDQKNCVTTNCDDKGKRLDFNVRPIAVSLADIPNLLFSKHPSLEFDKLRFPRYNVPSSTILSANQVLDAFAKPFDANYLQYISDAVKNIYQNYKSALNLNLDGLLDAKSVLDKNLKKYKDTINIQYYWDWVSDIVGAFNEIATFKNKERALCCVDESLFPFHVVLGGNSDELMIFRTPFFSTNNSSSKAKKSLKQLQLLFEKLLHILNSFEVAKTKETRITPSSYGNILLSEKAIPFYYADILDLKEIWNPKLSLKEESDRNLCYHSTLASYTSKAEIKTPLLYETEPYNFFRIEGHIGKNYKEALTEILTIQETHQLPFKVIALNAAQFKNLSINKIPEGTDWGYLESDYDLVRRDWENVIGKTIEWLEFNQGTIRKRNYVKDRQFFDTYIMYLKRGRNAMVENFNDFIKIYKPFIPTYEKIEELSIKFREAVYNIGETPDAKFDEDLIDHIDEAIMVCEKGEFRALYEAAMEKWKTMSKNMSLQGFIEKHPGLEHKAGVTKGGTFVLVYKENLQRKFLTAQFLQNVRASNKINRNTDKAPAETSGKIVNTTSANTEQDCGAFMENSIVKMQNYFSYYHPEIAVDLTKYLHYYFNPKIFIEATDIIPDQTVIADFFVPYLCCSEGDCFNFILEKTPPVEHQPGDFLNTDFNNTDFFTNK